jgi:hypothetical protein
VNGQLHAPATLPPRERTPSTHSIGGWVGPRANLNDVEGRFLTLPGFELWPLSCPARSQLLYRLCYPGSYLFFTNLLVISNDNNCSHFLCDGFLDQAAGSVEGCGWANYKWVHSWNLPGTDTKGLCLYCWLYKLGCLVVGFKLREHFSQYLEVVLRAASSWESLRILFLKEHTATELSMFV